MQQRYCLNGEIDKVRYGVWIDGDFSWLDSEAWVCESINEQNKKRLFTNKNKNISLSFESNLYDYSVLQAIKIVNFINKSREIKLFFSQNFTHQAGGGVTFYAPSAQAIVCCYNNHYLLLNGMLKQRGIVQYSTNFEAFQSLNDGSIIMQPFASRATMSIFSLEGQIGPCEELDAYFWLCSGNDDVDVLNDNTRMQLNVIDPPLKEKGYLRSCSN